MRIYVGFREALGEIKRDLSEMGTLVSVATMQDKVVSGDKDYDTMELQNYVYTVLNACDSLNELSPTLPWADAEFKERIDHRSTNPGVAYTLRPEVWEEFLHNDKFSYTYSERMSEQLSELMAEIVVHPTSRQLYLSIWDPHIDVYRLGGVERVPCSLGYLFQVRGGTLNVTYMMRSCDYSTHMQNDLYLATRLLSYMADMTNLKPGNLTVMVGSLHMYRKDCKGVF